MTPSIDLQEDDYMTGTNLNLAKLLNLKHKTR